MSGSWGPHWEKIPTPPGLAGPIYMDAELTPHRSLSRRTFALVLSAFALFDASIMILFLLRGAAPVAVFLALDVLALWIAFRINYRDGRAIERVEVGADRLIVSRQAPNGKRAFLAVSPLWARARVDRESVRIASAGKSVRVGRFLSPPERSAFALALDAALVRARREGYRFNTSRIE